jgi:hypothetical protein
LTWQWAPVNSVCGKTRLSRFETIASFFILSS